MRIGIDASRANVSVRTGTEWYSYEIIRELLRRDQTNQYVLYVKEPLVDDFRAFAGRAEIRLLRWPPKFLWSLLRLSWEMLIRPPDVLFVPAHTVPLIHPRRLVTTCHDVGFERYPSLYAQKPIGPKRGLGRALLGIAARLLTLGRYGNTELDYHRFSMRQAVRRAARIIVPSQFTSTELQSVFSCPAERITIIPHGLNELYRLPPTAEQLRVAFQKWGIRQPYLLFIGRWEEKKNIRTLLKAFERLRSDGRPEELVLAGVPGFGFEAAWAELLEETKRHIRLCRGVRTEAPALMAGASVLAFPSAYEGFGLPLLEAMASGTPIVASDRASIPEVLGDAGLLVQAGQIEALRNGLLRVLTDEPLRRGLIERGRRRVTSFTWEKAGQLTQVLLTNWEAC